MRRRWQRNKDHADHADDWLMTYADMITLLLCFFVIFLSVSVPKKNVPPKRPPDVLEGNLPLYGLSHNDWPGRDGSVNVPVKHIEPEPPKPSVVDAIVQPPQVTVPPPTLPPVLPSEIAKTEIPKTEVPVEPIAKPPASLPEIVNRLKAGGPADIEQKGDRITTLQMNSAAFFGSGSAALSETGKSILRDVAINLKSEKFRDYQITVEGHTDDQPISTPQFPSNWELSTARAAAVVQFFLSQGVPAQKLRAAGYADTFPVAPNRDASGKAIPENQARNRRVVIKLEKIEKAE